MVMTFDFDLLSRKNYVTNFIEIEETFVDERTYVRRYARKDGRTF